MLLEPTALASAFRYLAETLAQDYGQDPATLFKAAGFPVERTRESGARISQQITCRLWEISVAATGDEGIGLKVGARIRPEGLYALGYAWMSSANLVDALERFARYVEVLVTIPVDVGLGPSRGGYQLTLSFPDPTQQPHEAGIDATLFSLVALASQAARKSVRPRAVSLQRDCQTPSLYANVFGIPVEFGAECNAILFDGAIAEEALPTDNPDVAAAVDDVADRYVASLRPRPVAATVRNLLRSMLPTGEAAQENVAKRLNRSLSTLQRQLQAEGVSYRRLLDETRRNLAEAYLRQKRFSQAEIAYLLGFSDQSTFSRAYRRWTGRSPGAYEEVPNQ